MFEEEHPHLSPLPVEPFRYYRFGKRVVHLDGQVEVACAYHSMLSGNVETDLLVQRNDLYVRVLIRRPNPFCARGRAYEQAPSGLRAEGALRSDTASTRRISPGRGVSRTTRPRPIMHLQG